MRDETMKLARRAYATISPGNEMKDKPFLTLEHVSKLRR
jgi:hypothetical protein